MVKNLALKLFTEDSSVKSSKELKMAVSISKRLLI